MPSPRSRSPQARLSCTCTGTLAPGSALTPPPACAPPRAQVNLRQLHSLLNFAAQDAVVATSYFPNWFQIPYPCAARTPDTRANPAPHARLRRHLCAPQTRRPGPALTPAPCRLPPGPSTCHKLSVCRGQGAARGGVGVALSGENSGPRHPAQTLARCDLSQVPALRRSQFT